MIEIKSVADAISSSWKDYWPSKDNFVNHHKVTETQYQELKKLIEESATETEIERFLAVNKEVLALLIFLFSTGHQAAWVYPKKNIRPSVKPIGGMIPDYILAGANSNGVSWFILELKGANHKAFIHKSNRVYLSSETNKGICQLFGYIDLTTKSQSYLRDELKLSSFREPKGILLIGTEKESDDEQICNFKGSWNRMNPNLQIVSYNRLLRLMESKLID